MKSPYSAYRTVLALLMAGFVSFVISGCSSSGGSGSPSTASRSCTVNDGASDNTSSTDTSGNITFTLDLDCDNSLPQAASDATGTGTITLDPNTGALSGSVTSTGLSGPITAAHIHTGTAGNTGGIIVTLEADATDANTMNVPSATVLDAGQIQAMRSAQYYINVHTDDNQSGEIRGQIVPEGYQVILVKLDGDNETPDPVNSDNSGLGFVTLNEASGDVQGSILTSGLDDANAAHLHRGFAGTNGGNFVTLDKDTVDLSRWSIPNSTTLASSDLDSLLAGGIYINVHTPAFPAGEVRGQIEPDDIKIRRVELDGSEEVPSVPTAASGIGYVTVNENIGDIVANVRTSGIVAVAAHVHQAPAGSNGGVAVGLNQGTDTDFWSATGTLTAGQLTAFQASELYFNVHSVAYPDGEIRAQIRR